MFGHVLADVLRPRSLCLSVLVAFGWLPFGESKAAEAYDNCTGFIDSIPATITLQGNWCLRRDLSTNITSGNAIVIAANNVVLDCNDFKIGNLGAGVLTQAIGIRTSTPRHNTSIRRCNVRGFSRGIVLTGTGHLVEDSRIDSSRSIGIVTEGENSIVRNNMIISTSSPGTGFATAYQGNASFTGNTISGVSTSADGMPAQGIVVTNSAATPVEISNNIIRSLRVSGTGSHTRAIHVSDGTVAIRNNRVFGDRDPSPGVRQGIVVISGSRVICRDNVFSRFDTTTEQCAIADGNLALP